MLYVCTSKSTGWAYEIAAPDLARAVDLFHSLDGDKVGYQINVTPYIVPVPRWAATALVGMHAPGEHSDATWKRYFAPGEYSDRANDCNQSDLV